MTELSLGPAAAFSVFVIAVVVVVTGLLDFALGRMTGARLRASALRT
jgi:iron(III) transport system permease protein